MLIINFEGNSHQFTGSAFSLQFIARYFLLGIRRKDFINLSLAYGSYSINGPELDILGGDMAIIHLFNKEPIK